MLFQAVVIFLSILNFFKFHVKGKRSINVINVFNLFLVVIGFVCHLNLTSGVKLSCVACEKGSFANQCK